MADKNLEQLLDVLQSALLVNPGDGWKRVRLGQTLQKLGRLDEAVVAFRRAVRDKPDYPEGHAALGSVLAEQGNWAEAEPTLRKAIELKPELVEPHVELAQGYARLGQHEKAAIEFKAALALKPDLVSLLREAAATAVASRRFDEAVSYLIRAREQAPTEPEILLSLGLAHGELAAWPASREALEAYVALQAGNVEAWVALARACAGTNDRRATIHAHERTIALRADDLVAHEGAGLAYALLEEHEPAVRF